MNNRSRIIYFTLLMLILILIYNTYFSNDEAPSTHLGTSELVQRKKQEIVLETAVEEIPSPFVIDYGEVPLLIDDPALSPTHDENTVVEEHVGEPEKIRPSYEPVVVRVGDLFELIMSSPDKDEYLNIPPNKLSDKCRNKDQAEDTVAKLRVVNHNGDVVKNHKYIRLWKNIDLQGGLPSRTLLVGTGSSTMAGVSFMTWNCSSTMAGVSFMTWNYAGNDERLSDQWIYLPSLRKVRHMSVRDPEDTFFGGEINHVDIKVRKISNDRHRLIKSSLLPNGKTGFIVESIPKDEG